MSKATRNSSVIEEPNETKGQVEITIVRSRPITVSSDSITKKFGKPMKILGRIEEMEGNQVQMKSGKTVNKKTCCPSKFNVASPSSFHSNFQQCESKNPKSDFSNFEEMEEKSYERIEKNRNVEFCKTSFESAAGNNDNRKSRVFVELEALHRVLDKLRPDDVESTSAWVSSESCCREIVSRFQNLLSEWASDSNRVDDFLANDNSLMKCQHCGVIKFVPESQKNLFKEEIIAEEDINKKTKVFETPDEKFGKSEIMKCNEEIITAERDKKKSAINVVKSIGKSEVMRNSCPVVPPRRKDLINSRGKMQLVKNSNIIAKKNVNKVDKNRIVDQSCEKKEIIQSNELSGFKREETSKNIDSTLGYCEKYLEENHRKQNSHPLMETVEYLARGNLNKDKKSQDTFCHESKKETGTIYLKKPCNQGNNSFALHGSRDIDFHQDPNFFLCDRLRLCEDELKNDFHYKRKDIKIEKGEDSARFSNSNDVQLKESETSTFSSSSAENMIRRWIKPKSKILPDAMPEKIVRKDSKETFTAGTSLHKVQSIRDRINEAIQKFSSRSDISLCAEANLLIDKKNSISTIKQAKNIDTIHLRNKNTQDPCSSSALSVLSSTVFEQQRLSVETSERFERQILYDQVSSRDTNSEDSINAARSKVLLMYRRILESNEEMDWESFENLVSALHPCQRELWCDICKAISNEAKRVADETGATTEVCIEINPRPSKLDKEKIRSNGNEITFELDMIVQDFQAFINNNANSAVIEKYC